MPANTAPIFSRRSRIDWVNNITAANTARDGTGTVDTVFTADAVEGSFVNKLIVRPRGTNVARVMRVFVNNGLTNATAANNVLVSEIGLVATTATEVAAVTGIELPLNLALPAGFRLQVTLGTAVAAGFGVAVAGGDY
jgi:hypothetical protein